VGLIGLSYGGISQLFVAATRPPSLAAIAPLSVIDDTMTTLYPGGVLNTGFGLSWAKDRVHDAKAASATGGQKWALTRIRGGDATCRANQALHPEAVDLLRTIRANRYYNPAVADPLAPRTFVNKIKVPVFLACQWTDEQTGGHCPALTSRFAGTSRKWFTFTNGTHIDSLDPATFNRWYDFLELFVARRPPRLPDVLRNLAPVLYNAVTGVPDVTLPGDPLQGRTSYAEALAAFEAQPRVRVLFDNGAGSSAPGAQYAAFEQGFPSLPVPGTQARAWYLGDGGTLADAAPATARTDRFRWDRGVRPATDFSGNTAGAPGGLWNATPPYHWQAPPAGTAVAYETTPLAADTVVIGPGALTAWIRSATAALDLQVAVSEVRPDGIETFVQGGWLRGTGRKLDQARSTELAPVPSLRRKDDAPLPTTAFARVDVPLYYQGHAYRAGSRIRVTITAPGADQPLWAFGDARPQGTAVVAVAHGAGRASKLVLPVVPGVAVPTPLPPCPGLRGEPCRPAQPIANQAG
jgi:predicted acyl esterase